MQATVAGTGRDALAHRRVRGSVAEKRGAALSRLPAYWPDHLFLPDAPAVHLDVSHVAQDNRSDVAAAPLKIFFEPTLDNYRAVLFNQYSDDSALARVRVDIPGSFLNSLIIAGGATIVAMVLGNMAAFALARYKMPEREVYAFFFLAFRFAPVFVFIIPMFLIYQQIHLYNTYLGLILIFQVIAIPLIVWVMRSFYESIPPELFDSAALDGATRMQQLRADRVAAGRAGAGGDGGALLHRLLEQLRLSVPAGGKADADDHPGHDYLHRLRRSRLGNDDRGGDRDDRPGTDLGDACAAAHRARFDLRRGQGIAARKILPWHRGPWRLGPAPRRGRRER